MYHNNLFAVKNLVNHAVIAYTEFVQSRKVACIWFWANAIQICGKPVDPFGDSTSDGFIQSL